MARRAAHGAGLRYTLNNNDMPGPPDMVFRRHKVALFTCCCYGYGHALFRGEACHFYTMDRDIQKWYAGAPKYKSDLEAVLYVLRSRGWAASVLWRCEIADETGPPAYQWSKRPHLAERICRLVRGETQPSPIVSI